MEILTFKEFFDMNEPVQNYQYSDMEVANIYFHNKSYKIRDISAMTGKSVSEIYEILHRFGKPNRKNTYHDHVKSLAEAGMSIYKIAELTGYSTRNIRYILKNLVKE